MSGALVLVVQVVTLTDEGTLVGTETKKRQQKIYADVLGRTVKTEVLNWQGGSVYSTTVNTYNARDQLNEYSAISGYRFKQHISGHDANLRWLWPPKD